MKQKIIFTVTNDLSFDQRMHKICTSLSLAGYDVKLVGRLRKKSIDFNPSNFSIYRIKCWFDRGKLFYIEYNIRLFFYLLFTSFDIISSVDLDTITACYCAGKLKAKPIVFDAHEYFPEVPEVLHRPVVQKVWYMAERFFIPRIKYLYTVSDGLAEIFKKKYNVAFSVIRNISALQDLPVSNATEKYILYQGMLNKGRGLEQLIDAMPHIDTILYLAGDGDITSKLKIRVSELKLEHKVKFLGLLKPEELKIVTVNACIGINLLENVGISYHFSLSNKFFDYIHAGIPQIAMNFPEYKKLNDQYQVAILLDDLDQQNMIRSINLLLNDKGIYENLKESALRARNELCWQNEENKLIAIYGQII